MASTWATPYDPAKDESDPPRTLAEVVRDALEKRREKADDDEPDN